MSDLPGSTGSNSGDQSPLHDPTAILPVVPPTLPPQAPQAPQATAATAAMTPPPMQVDEYRVPDRRWYQQPGTMIAIAFGAILLLGVAAFVFFRDDNADTIATTEVDDSVQLEISRITQTGEPVATTLSATVTGPIAQPADYQWILPAGAQAPKPASGTTDSTGLITFAWAPFTAPADDNSWSSTVTLNEVLAPNSTLAALSYECVLERDDTKSNVTLFAEIAPVAVTEPREVKYSFAGGVEFVLGDSISCPILAGDPNVEPTLPTTTLPPETTTIPETSTIPESTLAPTTLPPATIPPVVTTATTVAPATTATTAAPKTTVITVIASRTDLSTFSNLIDRAGLRERLSAQNAMFTVVAPNNAAIEALLATPNPPDLNDPAVAREFVLAHVKTGEVLTRADLTAMLTITFDFGPERTIDATASPITIGGAGLIEADAAADLGIVHTLDATLITPAP